jgi:hypothetical protein
MPKLCQIIAVAAGAKAQTDKDIAQIHHAVQKQDMTHGLLRVYSPKDEEGEKLPGECQPIRMLTQDAIIAAAKSWTRLFDIIATQDAANTEAKAHVVVAGETEAILLDVPVTSLLFLEKRLVDIRTFIEKLPVLDAGMNWTYDDTKGVYIADEVVTMRTAKVQKPIVLYPATEQHAAQTQLITEDVAVGTWTTTHLSSALPADAKKAMLERVGDLQRAVKFAREEANTAEVQDVKVGDAIFDYIFEN